ncbi:MAG: TetR/AcrR family transcriptional regulator [Verrucomicrobiota bacterium]
MGRKSDSRQRLMDAAHGLIWSYSSGAVTIEAICDRARVKKGSFYYFFDSKVTWPSRRSMPGGKSGSSSWARSSAPTCRRWSASRATWSLW